MAQDYLMAVTCHSYPAHGLTNAMDWQLSHIWPTILTLLSPKSRIADLGRRSNQILSCQKMMSQYQIGIFLVVNQHYGEDERLHAAGDEMDSFAGGRPRTSRSYIDSSK
jgi:hypothetical protein